MKVSYCSTCKGRMWQLEKTLIANLQKLETIDAEWIIYDYASPDDFSDILPHHPLVKKAIESGKLKIYKHILNIPFSMPLAKNLAHHYATGDIVFNLDIDNFIGDSFEQLTNLQENQFLWAVNTVSTAGAMGRIGVSRKVFMELGGYDLNLAGVGYDDINFAKRLEVYGLKCVVERNVPRPIPNTREDSTKFTDSDLTPADQYRRSKKVHDRTITRGAKVNPHGSTVYQSLDLTTVTSLLTV